MKKRIILCLVSIFVVIISVFALAGCTTNIGNQDAEKANFVSGTTPYETLKTFVKTFPDRTAEQTFSEDNSLLAAEWIKSQFDSLGYTPMYDDGIDSFRFDNVLTKKQETGYNVAFKKESSSDKTVVIGAHYDNVYQYEKNGERLLGDGTYNNGVGIATLIEVAKVLANEDLPFDVEFVAFGAEEPGWLGSKRFLSNHVDKDNIILMINFDRNAIGDYVYMYSSEANTKHNKFFYQKARDNNLCIADLPSYRSPSLKAVMANSLYSNEANFADSQVFLSEGINIVNFISMNFTPSKVVERKGADNVNYTPNDNFDYIVQSLGGEEVAKQLIDKQINSAISAVKYAFDDPNFVEVMETSKANGGLDTFANYKIMTYIATGIVGAVILCFVVIYFVLKKNTKTHDVYLQTIYGRLNTRTGQIEPNYKGGMFGEQSNHNTRSDNTASVFGEEFETNRQNQDNANAASEDGSGNTTSSSGDKTTDIFGDF